MSKIVQNKTWK